MRFYEARTIIRTPIDQQREHCVGDSAKRGICRREDGQRLTGGPEQMLQTRGLNGGDEQIEVTSLVRKVQQYVRNHDIHRLGQCISHHWLQSELLTVY